jgi:hypothetical protein
MWRRLGMAHTDDNAQTLHGFSLQILSNVWNGLAKAMQDDSVPHPKQMVRHAVFGDVNVDYNLSR